LPATYTTPKTPITLKAENLPIPPQATLIQLIAVPDEGLPGETVGPAGEISTALEDGRKVVRVSLGKAAKIKSDIYRQAGGKLADWLLRHPIPQTWLETEPFSHEDLASFCEGLLLNAYRFDRYKKKDTEDIQQTVTLHALDSFKTVDSVVKHAEILIGAVNLQRDWAHEPANQINPVTLSEQAVELAESLGIRCTILDDRQLTSMGAGAITAVGKGSQTPSRMIVLEYPGRGKSAGQAPVALVGKAITFDTGGYSLKDTAGIQTMKYDKCGGLNVLGIIKAAVELKLETPLVGVICAAENMISGVAYRPDDILTSLSGKTIEIVTTDAEGRLVLADGLTYVQRTFNPRLVIDMATLTGGVVTALGRVRAGLFSNNDQLAEQLFKSGEVTHERLWRLPLDEDYFAQIKGDDGDIKNSGGKEAHPVMGGIFLQQFIENDLPWAHLDIAGVADIPKDLPYTQKGATGFGVRLIIHYLENIY